MTALTCIFQAPFHLSERQRLTTQQEETFYFKHLKSHLWCTMRKLYYLSKGEVILQTGPTIYFAF